jgi:heparosan-N-sulfate-glucuronate 5-epimerase
VVGQPGTAPGGRLLRRVLTLARGAAGAAFSLGPGYEPQPPGRTATYDRVSGYYLDLRQKAAAELRPRVTGRGEVNPPGPTTTSQRALGFHERWLLGDEPAFEPFLAEIRAVRDRAEQSDRNLLWPHHVDVPKYRLRAPLYSAMAQGQAASALVRAYLATNEDEWAEAARAAIRPLLGDGVVGLVAPTDDGPVLEEVPSEPPAHVLNGWIFALWGLWDVAVGLGDDDARQRFHDSEGALERLLPSYDVGWWSRYSLFPDVAPDLAKPFYHRIHVVQLPALEGMTGRPLYSSTATRWASYDRALNRSRAVATKGQSVIREAWLGRSGTSASSGSDASR